MWCQSAVRDAGIGRGEGKVCVRGKDGGVRAEGVRRRIEVEVALKQLAGSAPFARQ